MQYCLVKHQYIDIYSGDTKMSAIVDLFWKGYVTCCQYADEIVC